MHSKNWIISENDFSVVRIILLVFAFLLVFTFSGCSSSKTAFDHNKWIDAENSGKWNTRKKMAQDLVNQKILIGKSKSEVIQLLGKSKELSNTADNELYYTIDLEYGTDIDPVKVEYLIIYLNADNKAINAIGKIVLDK